MSSLSHSPERLSLASSRLRKHGDFLRAYAAARKRQSANMSWFLAPQAKETATAPQARIGLTVGKHVGKAHERNRIKRRMHDALRRHVDLLPAGFDLIFHPRRNVFTMEFAQLEREVLRILEQARSESAQVANRSQATPRSISRPAS